MAKKRKITKQQYERAKRIITEYESQFSLSFVRGSFSLDDLDVKCWHIAVPKLTQEVFDDSWCFVLEDELNQIKNFEYDWVNVDNVGHLVVSFSRVLVEERHVNTLLDVLNSL